MLGTEVAARALLGSLALPSAEMAASPYQSGLLARQANCGSTQKVCVSGCIPITGICCAS